MKYASYDTVTGEILFIREVDEFFADYYRSQGENLSIMENPEFTQLNAYVADGITLARPTMPLTVTGSVISGIPQGATVTLDQQSFVVDDGEADIEGYTGTVKISCWPYLDAEVTL